MIRIEEGDCHLDGLAVFVTKLKMPRLSIRDSFLA